MATLILLNKPYNVLCQFRDGGQDTTTLADYVTTADVYPAGRLDRDSEGLVLLTDDGRVQHCISHPQHKMPKTYWVQVEGVPHDPALQQLTQGVTLHDGPCAPAQVRRMAEPAIWPRTPPIRYRAAIPTCWLELVIREGRNRQVRRMTAAVGFPTLRLIRYAVGQWNLDNLAPGKTATLNINVEDICHDAGIQSKQASPHRRRRDRAAGTVSHGRGNGQRQTGDQSTGRPRRKRGKYAASGSA